MKLLKLFSSLLQEPTPPKAMIDTLVYQISTQQKNYCGRIIHQDDVMIKLQSSEGKPVKILKENVKSIVIA